MTSTREYLKKSHPISFFFYISIHFFMILSHHILSTRRSCLQMPFYDLTDVCLLPERQKGFLWQKQDSHKPCSCTVLFSTLFFFRTGPKGRKCKRKNKYEIAAFMCTVIFNYELIYDFIYNRCRVCPSLDLQVKSHKDTKKPAKNHHKRFPEDDPILTPILWLTRPKFPK